MENKSTKVTIANITMPSADKEYSWALPKGCQRFTLHTRDGTAVRVAVEPDKVATSQEPYWTVKANNSWSEEDLGIDIETGLPLFFACGSAGKTVEVIMSISVEF